MGEMSHFQRGQIIGSHLAIASVSKMATLLGVSRTAVYKVIMAYTNQRKTSSSKRNSS
jgi:NADH:ubiquinone oxidoreductase subunit E